MWSAILQFLLNYIEKNPQMLEQLITALINLFVSNPAVLNKAVVVAVAHAEASLPPTVTPTVTKVGM